MFLLHHGKFLNENVSFKSLVNQVMGEKSGGAELLLTSIIDGKQEICPQYHF